MKSDESNPLVQGEEVEEVVVDEEETLLDRVLSASKRITLIMNPNTECLAQEAQNEENSLTIKGKTSECLSEGVAAQRVVRSSN